VLIDGQPIPPGHPVPLLLRGQEVGYVSEFAYSKRVGATIGVAIADMTAAETDAGLQVVVGRDQYAARRAAIPFVG